MRLSFDSWIDRQIDASMKTREMDDLPGKGKPLPGINGRYDPDWWIKEKLKRDNLDLTPKTTVSRRKVEVWMQRDLDLSSVSQGRRQADALNEAVQAANKTDLGPHLPQTHP